MSIHEIAAEAGVSSMTVSRYINGGKVSPETGKRIREIMKTRGYVIETNRPGRKSQARKGIKTGMIAFLSLGDLDISTMLTQPTYSKLLNSLIKKFNEQGMNTMLLRSLDGVTIPKKLSSKYCDGVVIFGRGIKVGARLKARLKSMPSIWSFNYGVDPDNLDMDQVAFNNSTVGSLAANYLIKRNNKKIAYAIHAENQISMERSKDFLLTADEQDVTAEVICTPNTEETSYTDSAASVAEKIMAKRDLTGLAFFSDSFMLAVYTQLLYRGYDMSKYDILGCNNTPQLLELFPVVLPSIELHYSKIGKVSAEMLLKRINMNNNKEYEIKMYEPEIRLCQ